MDQLSELEACRICVTCYPLKEMDFIYLFQKNEEFQQELDFIQGEIRQWQLKIKPDDGLPQRICADCFSKFCSIDAFRKECEQAQEKLVQTVLTQTEAADKQPLLTPAEGTPLPLVGGNVPPECDQQVLVSSSVSLAQTDVTLSDFRVFDQQFDHFDNPTAALLDSSSTLLDNNLIAPESSNELGFLPSQNLFTFEAADPPSSGTLTLPLDETESPSIMGEIMGVRATVERGEPLIKEDLEDILEHSVIQTIATSINSNQKNAQTTATRTKTTNELKKSITPNIKTDVEEMFKTTNISNKISDDNPTSQHLAAKCEENTSDNECDDSNINKRLKGLSYTCQYCYCPDSGPIDHLSFPDEDALSQHFFDIHDPNRPYTCPQCQNSYKTQKLRDNHVRLIHEIVKAQKCNYCQKNLRGAVEIHQFHCQHIGDWECTQCKEKFPQTPLYRFRLHQRQHERSKNMKCRICERFFMRKANLEAHERMHKNDAKSQWHCQICKTNFLTNYDLKRHNYQHHHDESPVKCKECNQGFSSIAFLQRHVNQIHNSNVIQKVTAPPNVHICLKCNTSFTCLENLQKHMDEANKNNGQCVPPGTKSPLFDGKERRRIQRQGVFPCFLCPRRFHLRSQLDKHLNTHDARLRPFQCDQCYARCRTAMELKQHVNVTHLNIKAFTCEKCGKCFGYKKDLRDHMLFHAEINVHCTEDGCDYVCKNDKALMDHIRHKHRLLSCEYCHEEFTRQKLTVHLRNVHRDEIDVQLAGESDYFYKSQLLNNNNDITQISFNLLNTQKSMSTKNTTASLSTNTSTASASVSASALSSSTSISPNLSPISSSNMHLTATTTNSSSISTSLNDNNNNSNNQQQPALPTIFVTDHNSNNLALNGFTSSLPPNELNLVSGNNANAIFMVSPGGSTSTTTSSGTTNENNLDQYFVASLMDTEQEITVT